MKQLAFISKGKVVSIDDYADEALPSNHLIDVTALSPQPTVGCSYDGIDFKGIRRIHKSFFINRLNPWWADIKAARAADPVIDNYFEQFGHFTHVDLDWPITIVMVAGLKAAVLAVNASSTFDDVAVLQDGTLEEQYGV
jgi:hypothetical protein